MYQMWQAASAAPNTYVCFLIVLRSPYVCTHADIRGVLKSKDEEYVKLLKRQAADVDTLLGAMSRQMADLAAAYREELENVERALLQVGQLAARQLASILPFPPGVLSRNRVFVHVCSPCALRALP